jgi:ABC-type polysaccharide/polyol phosphate export permease
MKVDEGLEMNSSRSIASRDLAGGISNFRAWTTLAFDDLESRYARTALGPFWVTISHAIFVCGYAFWSSVVLKQDLAAQFLYVATSLTVWIFISTSLSEAPYVYARAHSIIMAYDLPISLHVHRAVLGQGIAFLHNMFVYVAVIALVQNPLNANCLLAIPGAAIVYVAATGWTLSLGVLAQRFRDIGPLMQSVLGALFILTPVFWRVSDIQKGQWIAHFNPFYYLLEVVRAPLLGTVPTGGTWVIAIAVACASLLSGIYAFVAFRKQLSYWM